MRRGLVWIALIGGCPRSPESPAPKAPEVVIAPRVAPTPWWTDGDKACPTVQATVPGAAPGATTHDGRIVRTPTDVYCEAAGAANGPATRLSPDGKPAETGTNVAGKHQGAWTSFHANSVVAAYGSYYLGVQTGPWSTWYASHRPRDRGVLQAGQRTGLWQEWDDDGDADRDPDRFVEYDNKSKVVMRGAYADGTPTEELPLCVIGLAAPACRVLPVVDLSVRADPTEGKPMHGKRGEVALELGGMVNLAPHHSIGATYGWVFDAIYPATVFEGRYRYWLVRWLAAEAGGGKLWGRNGGPDGVVAHIAIDAADIGTLTITFERLATSTGDETRALFGVRFGLPALGIAAAVASGSRQGPF